MAPEWTDNESTVEFLRAYEPIFIQPNGWNGLYDSDSVRRLHIRNYRKAILPVTHITQYLSQWSTTIALD